MKRFLIFTLFAFLTVAVSAQKRYDQIQYPELNKFEKATVEEFKLDNGITFYLVEDKELPLISVSVLVRTGSILDPDDKTGLGAMAGEVMREGGSEKYPADELNILLEDKAAGMSTSVSEGSGRVSMNILKEDFDELLPVFIDLIGHPAFPEDKIELYKTQEKSLISRRNDEQAAVAGREFFKLIYGEDSPLTRQEEYATIDAISRDDLVRFHKDAFVGNNMMVGVIGDFDTKKIKPKLQKAFSSLPAGKKTTLIYPNVDYQFTSTINFIDKPEVNQSYVLLGHIGGLRDNPDYAALQMMNQVLSGGFSGRLFQKVRSDLGLAYAVGGSYGSNIRYPGVFFSYVMTKSSTTAESIQAILREIKRLQEEPAKQIELDDALDRFLNSLVFNYDSKSKILNERISNAYNGMPQDTFDRYVEDLKKVTIPDIQRVAEKYLQPDKMQILVVGNKAEIGNQLDVFGTVNEIDITIPLPNADEDSELAGDAEKGSEWLKKFADAVIKPGTEVKSVKEVSNQTQETPMGRMQTKATTSINYADFSIHTEINSPQGLIEMKIADGKGTMSMMGQSQELPPMAIAPIMKEAKNDYVNIARTYQEVHAEYLGTENIEGKEYALLKIENVGSLIFVLDTDTGLPLQMRVNEFNMQLGKTVAVQTDYSDWKTVDGVVYAHTSTSFIDGEKAVSTVVETVTFNN